MTFEQGRSRPRTDEPSESSRQPAGLSTGRGRRAFDRRAFAAGALGLGARLPILGGAAPEARPAAAQAAALARQAGSGGTLRFARAEDSRNLDPVTNTTNPDIWVLMSLYDQLVRVAPSGTEVVPGLAEAWDISADGLTYAFRLRRGVRFADGSPLRPSDVVYSIERAKNDPSGTWTFTLTALREVLADGNLGVTMRLHQPWAPFLADLAMFNASVVSEAWARGNEDRLVEQPMGTGPFALVEWRRGEAMTLRRNPHYWEAGVPLLNQVRIEVVPDDNARVLRLQAGELDAIANVPAPRLTELRADPDLRVLEFPSLQCQYVLLNHRVPPLDDPVVRRALNLATDKRTLIDVVLAGAAAEATTFFPRGSLYWNADLPGFPHDPEEARRLLASAAPGGFALELMYLAGNAEDELLATVLQDLWGRVGVEVRLVPAEQGAFYEAFDGGSFQAQVNFWTSDIIDPDEQANFAVLPEAVDAFHTGWANPEAQSLARQGAAEADPATRAGIYGRLQEVFNEDAAWILLYHKPFVAVTTTAVRDFAQLPTGHWDWKQTTVE